MVKRTKEQIKQNMLIVRSKGSKIEQMLRKELWRRGFRYRKNNNSVYGKPDFTFKQWEIAIFCDGEFWHGKIGMQRKKSIKAMLNFGIRKLKEI